MQDKNVTHELNLGWLLSWCFWSWAPSSQSDPAVANIDSALPPTGFTKDGFYESGLEPFLFFRPGTQFVGPNTRQVSLLPRMTQFWWLWEKANPARAAHSKHWKGEMGLSSESWAELWRICDVDWSAAALFCTLYQQLCLNSLFLQRNRNWSLPNVLNFISGNGQIRF